MTPHAFTPSANPRNTDICVKCGRPSWSLIHSPSHPKAER